MKKRPPSNLLKLAKSESLRVSIRIGKDGVNTSLISELENQLEKRTVVKLKINKGMALNKDCLLYTSPSPRDKRQARMPSSA